MQHALHLTYRHFTHYHTTRHYWVSVQSMNDKGVRRSRRHPCQVAWERRRQLDIVHTRQLHKQALQPDSETTMRRHPILERLQVRLKRLDGQVRPLQRRYIVAVKMQPLPARHQFRTPEKQVKRG